MNSLATEILPNLWLGDINATLNPAFLKTKQINCLINCTKNPFLAEHLNLDITYTLPLYENDPEDSNLTYILFKSLNIISAKIYSYTSQYKCLIYDQGDHSIAICCILAYLIKYAKMEPNKAIQSLQSKRPFTNFKYLNLIEAYWQKLNQVNQN